MEMFELNAEEMELVDGGRDWAALGRAVGAWLHDTFCEPFH